MIIETVMFDEIIGQLFRIPATNRKPKTPLQEAAELCTNLALVFYAANWLLNGKKKR